MASEHRRVERQTKLNAARNLLKRILEDAVASSLILDCFGAAVLGDPEAGDFEGDEAAQQARLTETIIGIAAGRKMLAALNEPVSAEYPNVTVKQALLRIATA